MDTKINALKMAYTASPENIPLLFILLESLYHAGEYQDALSYLAKVSHNFDDVTQRTLAGNIAIKAGQPKLVENYCTSNSAEELLVKARAYQVLMENEKGLAAYRKAIEQNPSLEEPDLGQSLKAKITDHTETKDGNVVQLKMFSNEKNTETHAEQVIADNSGFLKSHETDVTFEGIGGLDDVKSQIHRKIILPFQKGSLFQKFKKKAGGGVLLYGPPGCGKTLLARATAGECKAKFYNVTISDILDMWVGNSEKRLHAIFEQARRTAPSVLFFDEIEGLAGKRQFNSDQAITKYVSQFLSEMDGFGQNNEGVLVLGATNVPWSVDPAFRRPGRFDRIQFIPPPDHQARKAILKIVIADRPAAPNIDFDFLAKMTPGFSGADLKHLIETACDRAIENSIEQGREMPISMTDLKEALKELKPTTLEWLTTASNYAKYSNEGGQYDEVISFLNKHGQ